METFRKPLNGVQKKIAQKMIESARNIPSVTTIREISLKKVVDLKCDMSNQFEKLTFMPFIIYAVKEALEKYPVLNAKLIDNEIVYSKEINISIAITVGENLIAPNIKGIENKNFSEIVDAIAELIVKAKNKTLTMSDYRDGTFTISNSGAFGGEIFTPMINYPESAILGIGRMKKKAVVNDDDKIEVCPMMYFCLTYDHRIINGHVAVSFLGEIENILNSLSISDLQNNGD